MGMLHPGKQTECGQCNRETRQCMGCNRTFTLSTADVGMEGTFCSKRCQLAFFRTNPELIRRGEKGR